MSRSLVLLACICLAVGCSKTKSPPERSQPQQTASTAGTGANTAIIAVERAKDSAFTLSLAIEPTQPRLGHKTRFTVKVTNASGAPVSGAQAHVSLVMPLMDMGKNEFDLKPAGDGTYQGTGEFTMTGEWEVVTTASAEGKTGKYTFNVRVAE
jgi:nitrogen fixation protein FixH